MSGGTKLLHTELTDELHDTQQLAELLARSSTQTPAATVADHGAEAASKPAPIEDDTIVTEPVVPPMTLNLGGAVTGTFVGPSPDGAALVDFVGNPTSARVSARSFVRLEDSDIGKEVLLVFDNGDLQKPLVIGIAQPVGSASDESCPETNQVNPFEETELVGKTITLTGKESIVLRCGSASITLTADGKIFIRGSYLQSRSSGVNRIQGGSVQIN